MPAINCDMVIVEGVNRVVTKVGTCFSRSSVCCSCQAGRPNTSRSLGEQRRQPTWCGARCRSAGSGRRLSRQTRCRDRRRPARHSGPRIRRLTTAAPAARPRWNGPWCGFTTSLAAHTLPPVDLLACCVSSASASAQQQAKWPHCEVEEEAKEGNAKSGVSVQRFSPTGLSTPPCGAC